MWTEFNIKTFAAETIVFRNGVFCPDLSTLPNTNITKKYDLPVHIIYVGEIADKNELNINIGAKNQNVFLSVRVKNKKSAFLNIFIKNAGKNSSVRGHIFLENNDNLTFNCTANHTSTDTEILLKTKLLAGKKSISKISGTAIIDKNCINTKSNIEFSALADTDAQIEFEPSQRISAAPDSADHSASIYRPNKYQIEYLRTAGLSTDEVNIAMREAFMNDDEF